MSSIETKIPQKQKEFNPKFTQDHGSAAAAQGHYKGDWDYTIARDEQDKFLLKEANEAVYSDMSFDEREDVADRLLEEVTEEERFDDETYPEEPFDDELPSQPDEFASEAEIGRKSKKEIKDALARRATLDHNDGQDDYGDSDFDSGMHIVRPR